MTPFHYLPRLPYPLKAFFAAWALGVPLTMVLVWFGSGRSAELALTAMGVVVACTGLLMLTNLNGGADAFATALREAKPLGVDYSQSPLASTGFVRFFGAFAILVGTLMAVMAFTGAG